MVRILSLDGGGVRGLSELLILESILEKVRDIEELKEVPLPCEYFDLIGGTSTGGIIAIMLGRLRMPVHECIEAYKSLSALAFTPKSGWLFPVQPKGQYSTETLEKALKLVIAQQCEKNECQDQSCPHENHLYRMKGGCKTVVLAVKKDDLSGPPTLFKTYSTNPQMAQCKIWEIARATSAATTFFESMACGRDGVEFVDAGFGYNNPCRILLDEAKTLFPKCKPDKFTMLSIGSGLKANIDLGDSRTSILLALKDMASDSGRVAAEMYRELSIDRYHRFNVSGGLENINLADWAKIHSISSHTHRYMDEPEQQQRSEACARALVSDKYTGRRAEAKMWQFGWNKFASHTLRGSAKRSTPTKKARYTLTLVRRLTERQMIP
ncbi:acyl transferase/acyl hydrolase/lysophospholipase [Amylocarpus encephaloides]|uniref:Acyl transferase/acyl hydrolase/lysophospholipase n=1 Tax=Amylocarpus encephaloides TaxID=45428 RepID=A0A9P8C6I7_9HELO|nr:acyl transferase/acyl hydrolase/lysophospholipase [Amylocarpus encephaloides]